MSVTSLHLLECALCAQLTPGYAYLVARTIVTVIVVLPVPVLVYGMVYRSTFDNRILLLTVLKLY